MKKIYLTAAAVATLSLTLSAGINSPRADGHISRCEAFMQEQNYQAALDQLRPLQESALTPAENRKVKFMRAKALYGAGDYAGAAVAFHAFIADFPEGIERQSALKGLGDCAFASGEYSEALKLYAAVAPEGLAGSENAEFNFRRAYCAMRQGNTELAREGFAKASEDASTRQGSLFYLGVIAFSEKEYSEARRYFKGLNTSASPGNMAEYYIAQIDFAESEWHKAASAAMHALRQPQLDAEMQAEMLRVAGESLCRSGNSSEGIKYLRRYLSATTAPAPSALYLVGVDDYTRGDYAEALERLRLVTDDSGVSEALSQSAYLYIGQCLLHQGDNAAALLAFGKAARSEADADVREAAFYNYAVARLRGASVPFASSADNFEKFLRLYPSGP
ncbi:MAG: tetratricopeptide repeat protein, partial [Muribaculaceae bacterium]|nr:tetratricopeptide repeat protein [Muribaculaceae bacterium]